MKLGRVGTSSQDEYVGPGYLRQEVDGSIVYKLYPPPPARFDPLPMGPLPGSAGRLLGPESFSRLDALDSTGIPWRVERTLPIPDACLVAGRSFKIVSGTAYEIGFSRPFVEQDVSCLTMVFFTEEKVPGNASTETTTVLPDGGTVTKSTLDAATFSTALGNFSIYNRAGMLVVEVVSSAQFPPHFHTRIVEALGFVLAKPLAWNVIERYENATETIRVRAVPEIIDAKLPPPIASGTVDMSGGDVWRVFEKYLTFISARTEDDFHPCSRQIFSVLEASAGAISARALALGVAVEGLVANLFHDAGVLPPTLKPVVRRLRRYFAAWEELTNDAIKESLYPRVEAMLGRILDVSAKSKLYALEKQQVVYESHIKAWGDLRHAAAHGVTPGSDDIQKLLDLCDAVTVLMYHLVFRAVVYEGRYKDYSVHGWPKKRYRGRPVTEEEIAIAAYYLWKKTGKENGHYLEHWFTGKDQLEKGVY